VHQNTCFSQSNTTWEMLKILKWKAALSMMKRIALRSALISRITHKKNNKMKIIDMENLMITRMVQVAVRKKIVRCCWHSRILPPICCLIGN